LTPPVPEPLEEHGNQENKELFIGIVSALCIDNRPHKRSAIFGAAGLDDYPLTPHEAAFASQTPNIPWKALTGIFGGQVYAERPTGRKVPGYQTLCLSRCTQPFAPTRIGEPGVIISPPDTALSGDVFHIFVDPSTGEKKVELQYCGLYTKAHEPMGVQLDEWHRLPEKVSTSHSCL
jgi:hypothetical protein